MGVNHLLVVGNKSSVTVCMRLEPNIPKEMKVEYKLKVLILSAEKYKATEQPPAIK